MNIKCGVFSKCITNVVSIVLPCVARLIVSKLVQSGVNLKSGMVGFSSIYKNILKNQQFFIYISPIFHTKHILQETKHLFHPKSIPTKPQHLSDINYLDISNKQNRNNQNAHRPSSEQQSSAIKAPINHTGTVSPDLSRFSTKSDFSFFASSLPLYVFFLIGLVSSDRLNTGSRWQFVKLSSENRTDPFMATIAPTDCGTPNRTPRDNSTRVFVCMCFF